MTMAGFQTVCDVTKSRSYLKGKPRKKQQMILKQPSSVQLIHTGLILHIEVKESKW